MKTIIKELHSITQKADRLSFLREKGVRAEVLAEKKAMYGIGSGTKHSSNAPFPSLSKTLNIFGASNSPVSLKDDEVFAVINSVGFMDSHLDVSMKGSWTKTVNERGAGLKQILDHSMMVKNIYAENLGAMVIEVPIRQLGYNATGVTEVFGVKMKPNAEMLDMYQRGMVTEHSAGLQYVKIELAINDEQEEEGYKQWVAQRQNVINGEMADEYGYFFLVYEQKAIETSAVVKGSNPYTPAFMNIDNRQKSLEAEPSTDTHKNEPNMNGFFNILLNK